MHFTRYIKKNTSIAPIPDRQNKLGSKTLLHVDRKGSDRMKKAYICQKNQTHNKKL